MIAVLISLRRPIFLAVSSLLAVACTSKQSGTTGASGGSTTGSSTGGSTSAGTAGGDAGPTCTVDPVKLAATTACHFDDDCPCGAHCELGLCAATCRGDGECSSGQYCDSFGRCRFQSDPGLIGVAPVAQPAIALRPTTLQLSTGDSAPHSVEIDIGGIPDGGWVRLHPDQGLGLTCPDGGSADAGPSLPGDCVFPASGAQRFSVQQMAPSDGGAPQEVHVYVGSQIQTLTLQASPSATVTPGGAPTAGTYTGQATLLNIYDALAGGDAGIGTLFIPIKAVVGSAGGTTVLALEDPSHTLAPFDWWTGAVTPIDGAYNLQLPAYRAISDLLMPDTDGGSPDVEVLLQPDPAPLTVTSGTTPTLSFTLSLTALGILADAGLPSETYAVVLSLIPDGGPVPPLTLDGGDVPTIDRGDLAVNRTPWANAFESANEHLPAPGASETSLADPLAVAMGNSMAADGGPLDACTRSYSEVSEIHDQLLGQALFDDPAVLKGSTSVSQVVSLGIAESTTQTAVAVPINGAGAPPFTTAGSFDFRNSANPAWQVLAQALSQVDVSIPLDPNRTMSIVAGSTAFTSGNVNLYLLGYVDEYSFSRGSNSIPCAFEVDAGTLYVGIQESCAPAGSGTWTCAYLDQGYQAGVSSLSNNFAAQIAPQTIDSCDAVAAKYGCQVVDADVITGGQPMFFATNADWPGGDGSYSTLSYTESLFTNDFDLGKVGPDTITWSAELGFQQPAITVSKVCSLPTPLDCVERAMCVSPTNTETDDPPAPDLGTNLRANTGDLACASGPRAADFAIDESAAAGDAGSAPQLLGACQQELAKLHGSLPPSVPAQGSQGLLELLPPTTCVEAGRWVEALEMSLSTLEGYNYDPANGSGLYESYLSSEGLAEVHRILQRWIKLHAFVAREEIERAPMAQVYERLAATNPGVVDPLGPDLTLQQDLDLSLGGWTLLLHPHFSPLIAQLAKSGAVLARPDYRVARTGAALGQFDQGEGLPVAMLQALDAQAELATAGVNQVWAASSPPDLTKLAGFEKVFRYVAAIRPLAVLLEESALAAATPSAPVAWLSAYQAASRALDKRLAGLTTALAKARSGQPAIGLTPNEVPLYFSGTVAGAGGEFSAISDYLLGGFPGDTTAWAPALVQQASKDLNAAEAAYGSQLNRQLEVAQSANGADAIRLKYGDGILNLCGSVNDVNGSSLTASQVLDQGPPTLTGTTCYQIQTSACQVTSSQLYAAYTADDLAYQVCVVAKLGQELGNLGAHFGDQGFEALATAGGCQAGTQTYSPTACSGSPCLQCTVAGGSQQSAILSTPNAAATVFSGAVTPDLEAAARASCRTTFPQAVDPLPGPSDVNPNLANGSCYQGALGQEALSLQSTSQNIAIARSAYADQMDAYNIAMQSCLILDQGNSSIESATASFNNTMANLRHGKLIEDSIGYVAGAAATCASAASNVVGDADGSTAVACGAAAVEAAAQIASAVLQNDMDNAQSDHDALVQQLQDSIAEQQCANNATQYMVGLHTQALRIQQAAVTFAAAQLQFNNDQALVGSLLAEGRQQLAAYTGRTTVDPGFDFWLSNDIDQFQKDFVLAQRATYLAVRAAEYEFQASLVDSNASAPGTTYESEVLAAKIPDDLSAVIDSVLQITATGGVLGNRPLQLSVILSMRDKLLQIADKSAGGKTAHALSTSQRFDELLASPKYAIYDQSGVYKGQQIPFDLAPLGSSPFGITDTEGVPIFAGNSCAERVWSVFAAIEGSDDVFVGDSTATFAQIDLLKSNTFYSQWCARPSPDGTQFQQALVDPGVNLFQDPTRGSPGQVSGFGTGSTEITFTPARLEAFFNVSPTMLSQQTYANGQSNELAARGLYGSYALFIPAGQISRPGVAGPSAGLNLNAIDDILIRIDYVSVAN